MPCIYIYVYVDGWLHQDTLIVFPLSYGGYIFQYWPKHRFSFTNTFHHQHIMMKHFHREWELNFILASSSISNNPIHSQHFHANSPLNCQSMTMSLIKNTNFHVQMFRMFMNFRLKNVQTRFGNLLHLKCCNIQGGRSRAYVVSLAAGCRWPWQTRKSEIENRNK